MEEKKSFNWENGDVAELANEERAIYLNGHLYCYDKCAEETGYVESCNYSASLEHCMIKGFNVAKVWRYPDDYCTSVLMNRIVDKHLKNAKVVFDAPIKMTLSEVCEALGKNIVIVKED